MSKDKFVETETHICNQVRYKVFKLLTELRSTEKVMDLLLEDNDPGNIKKIVIQPKNKIEEYAANGPGDVTYDIPWIKSKPRKAHNRIE